MKNIGLFVLFMLIAGGNAYSQGGWTKYTVENGLPTNHVNSLALSPDGKLLIGLADLKGVWCYSDGKFSQIYTTKDGLLSDEIQSIKIQDNKIIWISTWIGLSRFDGTKWTSYDDTNGLKYKNIIDFCFAPDGKVWCATFKEIGNTPYCAISSFDGSEWTSCSTEDSLSGNYNRLTSIAADKNGIVWMGTGYGLMSFDGSNWKRYTTVDGLNNDNINYLTTSPEGNVFVSNSDGLNILKNSEFEFLSYPEGFTYLFTITFLSESNFWIGGVHGIAELKDGKWGSVFNYTTGIEFIEGVSSIAFYDNGIIWIGLYYDGLVAYNPNYTSVQIEKNKILEKIYNYPNPFNSTTTINFEIEKTSKADIDVYSITGQHIKKLTSGVFQKGNHSITWKGDDDYGKTVSSGIYLIQLKNDRNQDSVLTTLIK